MPKVALVYLKNPPHRNPMVVYYTDFQKVDADFAFVYKDVYAIVFEHNEVIYWTQGEDSGKTTQI